MPFSVTMTNKQSVAIGATVLDQDKQPFTEMPAGASIEFVSSDPTVAQVTVRPDGFNIDIASLKNGTATITATASGFDPALPSDSGTVTVTNSKPGSLNLTPGEPTDEMENPNPSVEGFGARGRQGNRGNQGGQQIDPNTGRPFQAGQAGGPNDRTQDGRTQAQRDEDRRAGRG